MVRKLKMIKIPKHNNCVDIDDSNWMEDKILTVEIYMTEEQIGHLVKDYMAKTNGMPLQIFFPEYDREEESKK